VLSFRITFFIGFMGLQIITPRMRGFVCLNAHPTGCQMQVDEQVHILSAMGKTQNAPKRVLILGASTGYGLASWLVSMVNWGAKTIGISLERPSREQRTASAGWYNIAHGQSIAEALGLWSGTLIGDVFQADLKMAAVPYIQEHMGQIDCIIYSIAAPRRLLCNGTTAYSVIKPISQAFQAHHLNVNDLSLQKLTIPPATDSEINDTIDVMGGDDWCQWLQYFKKEGLLAHGCRTIAYTYIGPESTWPIYKNGTIGRAKAHLMNTASHIQDILASLEGIASIGVNAAVATQASAAIPMVPLYLSCLYRVLKEHHLFEDYTQQTYRVLHHWLNGIVDEQGYVRGDDRELSEPIQTKVTALLNAVTQHNVCAITDAQGYQADFLRLFGFTEGLDTSIPVEIDIPL
jgi:enoyl-[acyl-carrier protein] reductase / trans-2-enoyl-CoA reductase (NAD+)